MQVAHVILAHKDPQQVRRLILRLLEAESLIILHIDKKAKIEPFKSIISFPSVYFVKKRVDVKWGGFSQVEAAVNSFLELREIDENVEFINLLSGQDYPIKSIASFHEFLGRNPGISFMEYLKEDDPWSVAAVNRFNKYHFSEVNFFGKHKLEKLTTWLMPKRRFPANFKLVGKSQWFTIDNGSWKYILDVIENRRDIYRKFMYSWGADELVFQSILYNSELKHKLVNNNLRYIDWSEKKSSPKTLVMADKEALTASEAFFARKFDRAVDSNILDQLDLTNS